MSFLAIFQLYKLYMPALVRVVVGLMKDLRTVDPYVYEGEDSVKGK